MKLFGILMIVCVALALAKALITGLCIAAGISFLWAIAVRPREVIAVLASVAILSLVTAYPAPALVIILASFLAR